MYIWLLRSSINEISYLLFETILKGLVWIHFYVLLIILFIQKMEGVIFTKTFNQSINQTITFLNVYFLTGNLLV